MRYTRYTRTHIIVKQILINQTSKQVHSVYVYSARTKFSSKISQLFLLFGAKSGENMDYFWRELSKVVGPIPVSIKVILEQLRYIHGGLAYLNDDVINAMEEEVKHLPETTGKSDREWQKMIGFNGPLKNFRFVLGERSLLKVISNIVEKQGISKFTKKLIKQDSLGKSESAPETQTELSVRQKVIEFYTKK